ncbi:MAG: glycosyltransferase family 4 protein [Proteobacteria bacterium]|nr:glycosyltransferase family 4 protein [Pseudomonadota bacterium]
MTADSKKPLHMLYVSCARIPSEKAHAYQILKMCESFTELGVRVTLLYQKRSNRQLEQKAGNVFDYYDVRTPFEMKKLFCLDWILLGKINPRVQFYIAVVTYLWIVAFYIMYHRSSIDVIYCRDKFSLIVLGLIKSLFRLTVFYEAHEVPLAFSGLQIHYVKKMDGLIVVTEQLKIKFAERGVPVSSIGVAHDGVDKNILAFFRRHKRTPFTHGKALQICYTGHLYPWKGCGTLIQAMASLPGNFHLLIVGGLRQDIENAKKGMEPYAETKVDFKGYVSPGEVLHYVAASDILVIPNSGSSPMSSLYTSPLKLFEYMASGRPMVASRVPSLCEILKDGGNAVLVEPDNPRELAAGIIRVANDQALANAIAEQASIDVEQYTWGKRAEKIIGFMSSRA